MAILARRVTVGTTATRIDSTTDSRYQPTTAIVRHPTASVFIGGPGVTTATGFEVYAAEAVEWTLTGDDALYAVMAVASDCHVAEKGL